METKKKLSLNKETIVSLNSETMYNVQAGQGAWGVCNATENCDVRTGGCTDGCGSIMVCRHTDLMCTDGHCTRNCPTNEGEREKTSGGGYGAQ